MTGYPRTYGVTRKACTRKKNRKTSRRGSAETAASPRPGFGAGPPLLTGISPRRRPTASRAALARRGAMAHGPPEPPPADQAAEPSEVDVVDATAEAFRAAVAEGDLDRADRIAAALPRRELRDALRGLTPEQTEALYARLGDERLAELLE